KSSESGASQSWQESLAGKRPRLPIKRSRYVALETASCHETQSVHQEKHRSHTRPKRCRTCKDPDSQTWKVLHANLAPLHSLPVNSFLRPEKESPQLTRRKS